MNSLKEVQIRTMAHFIYRQQSYHYLVHDKEFQVLVHYMKANAFFDFLSSRHLFALASHTAQTRITEGHGGHVTPFSS